MFKETRCDLAHDLFLPTLLFAAIGGMTWAVRGCSGFGTIHGCTFAGVMLGVGWWFIARDGGVAVRRYTSGWVVPALTFGIGIAGARGWMQWHFMFEGKLMANAATDDFVPISRAYGFLWTFIAGAPWAGLGACLLAWCGSLRPTRAWHWALRIGCGIGGAALATWLYDTYPSFFLPLYESLKDRYQDPEANPNLLRLINDSRAAMLHLGFCLGFLLYEVGRRDWKNALLITTVGVVNGAGWALCQNWKWVPESWHKAGFNWWRCWETSGGISIGIAYGIAYFLVNRRMSDEERDLVASRRSIAGPNLEWLLVYSALTLLLGSFLWFRLGRWHIPNFQALGTVVSKRVLELVRYFGIDYFAVALAFGPAYVLAGLLRRPRHAEEESPTPPPAGDPSLERYGFYLGLLFGLGISIRAGLKGWFNIYLGNEDYWSAVLWNVLGPVYMALFIALAAWVIFWPVPRCFRGDLFPHAYGWMWTVLIVQNVIAQLITGPHSEWNEVAFSIYYVLLFFITAVITIHYHSREKYALH